jgi:ornithine cyclodeaminase
MLHLDAGALAARLPPLALVDALERAFRAEYQIPLRQHFPLGAASLLIMPAWRAAGGGADAGDAGALGVKLVTVFPDNAALALSAVHASYTLFDARTGVPRATMDGTELTRRRTGAASALAARYLADAQASRLLMVGTGGLAPHVIESHAAVRPIREVRIWGRRAQRARELAARFSGAPYSVEATEDLEAAVRWADIISCATLATSPLVCGAWLRPGQHLDLIGSFRPDMREADEEALLVADIYVDTLDGALHESGELVHAMAAGSITAADIRGELGGLVRGTVAGRVNPRQITLFKSVGSAILDLAAAELAAAP